MTGRAAPMRPVPACAACATGSKRSTGGSRSAWVITAARACTPGCRSPLASPQSLPELSVSGARPSAAFTAGLVLASLTPAVVGHLALGYPARTAAGARVLAAAGYVTAIGLLGLLPALAFDPARSGCALCADNLVG